MGWRTMSICERGGSAFAVEAWKDSEVLTFGLSPRRWEIIWSIKPYWIDQDSILLKFHWDLWDTEIATKPKTYYELCLHTNSAGGKYS